MAIQQTSIKVSKLPGILASEIDDNDLFLVTDVDSKQPMSSKHMTVKQLMTTVSNNKLVKTSMTTAANIQINASIQPNGSVSKAIQPGGTLYPVISNEISSQIVIEAQDGVLKPIILSEVINEISAQATPTGILAPVISSTVENALSTALSAIDGGSAFDF